VAIAVVGLWCGAALVRDAVVHWRQWHEIVQSDPSAADLYRTDFEIDVKITAFVGLVAAAGDAVLRAADRAITRS